MTASAGPALGYRVIPRDEWLARRVAHEDRVDALLAGHLARRRTGVPHPVEDFLFGSQDHQHSALPGSDQQQWLGQGSEYRAWNRA